MEKSTARIEGHALVDHGPPIDLRVCDDGGLRLGRLLSCCCSGGDRPEETVSTRTYVNGEYLLPGSRIRRRRLAVDQWIGASSIYRITECSAQTAQELQKVVVDIIERAAAPQIEAPPDASEDPTQVNVERLYTKLTGLLDLSEYDEGVRDSLGWVLRREPRPQLDVDEEKPDSMENEAEDIMDDLINAEQTSEYTGF